MQTVETRTTVKISYSEAEMEVMQTRNINALEKLDRLIHLQQPKFELTGLTLYYVLAKILDTEMRERKTCFVSLVDQVVHFASEQEKNYPIHFEMAARLN